MRFRIAWMGAIVPILVLGSALAFGSCSGDGPSLDDLADRVEASAEEVTAAITYDTSFGTTQVQTTIIQKPPHKRMNSIAQVGGQPATSSFITTGSVEYFCFQPADGEGTCLEGSSDSDSFTDELVSAFFDLRSALAKEPRDFELVEVSSRQVAGLDADCFRILPKESADELHLCLSQDDFLLCMEVLSADLNLLMEATSVRRDVNDEDFAPPYPVRDD